MLLYYVTDRKQFPGDENARCARLLDTIARAALAGVEYVQLREKDLSAAALETLARAALDRIGDTSTKLLINSRVDVAIAVGASGVHLPSGAEELPADEARKIFAKSGIHTPVIAVSCHSLEEIRRAEEQGTDFAVFGPVFEKNGTPNSLGLAELRRVCADASIPVLAIGGVTLENAVQCMEAGAAGVAAIRLFQQGSANMERRVAELRSQRP